VFIGCVLPFAVRASQISDLAELSSASTCLRGPQSDRLFGKNASPVSFSVITQEAVLRNSDGEMLKATVSNLQRATAAKPIGSPTDQAGNTARVFQLGRPL